MKKATIIGGGGIRTPLIIHGIGQSAAEHGITEIALHDTDAAKLAMVSALGRGVLDRLGSGIRISFHDSVGPAVEGADFVISSIRVGGIEARARDERLAIAHGIAGQETTGLGGLAMALRTIPATLGHARAVEKHAPGAWFISFTNPAGLITQALASQTGLRLIGICDTPSEMFHRIAHRLGASTARLRCDYFGLNHLGWIRKATLDGEDVTGSLLSDDAALRAIYHADLFDPGMIRALGLIPSEYLFFYYEQKRAYENQLKAGASRGEEISRLNSSVFSELESAISAGRIEDGLAIYTDYLRRRSGSYMKLEAEAGSALARGVEQQEDPFEAATGYHRIALDVITALAGESVSEAVVNVVNNGAIEDLADGDVVEVPCLIDRCGARPLSVGRLPEQVRGLVIAVKQYERLAIRAAVEGSKSLAKQALLAYPLIGQWRQASELVEALIEGDPGHLGYLK